MEVGLVQKIDIDSEMQQAYLDYAMSVIVARALPDARDGLKPVHRRILFAMHDMNMRADGPYKKSARIVGEVLGKYHPHGDMAVYDAMARMAQDFSLRYLLVDGQGNFGSVDGDPPAAMRYTEARMAQLAQHMLSDIQKNTVNFIDNFDSTLKEPVVLPAALPNLLVNGATGIAVGMATSIPPHNLGEVIDAIQYLLQNWEKLDDISIDELMQFVQGPDFPTGGVILQEAGGDGLVSAYSTGRGKVTVQAKAHLEEMERGRTRIIVTELPYMTNKASLIERIAELARDEKLEGIVDLRDESDRQGMRVVIELSKNADAHQVLGDLYKHTPMQSTFSIIMLALVNGEPRMLSLKQCLKVYIEHRLEIIQRRSEYDLEKARQRAHILDGLRVALKNLDEVIDLIRKSPDVETARTRLMKRFKLSEIQAQAILDMPLRRLAALERKKIEEEYKELQTLIKDLEGLLHSPKRMRQTVGDELTAIKETYNDRRRTFIVHLKEGEEKSTLRTTSDMMADSAVWISVNEDNLISRSIEDKQPRTSGRDAPTFLVHANARDILYLVNEAGDAAALQVHSLPETDKPSEGLPVAKVSPLHSQLPLAAVFALPARTSKEAIEKWQGWFCVSITRQGMLKKSTLTELPGASANTFTFAKVNDGDRLGWVRFSNGENEIMLVTAKGAAIRFNEEEVRPMGLAAAGVMGIKLGKDDEVIGAELLPHPGEVFLIANDGSAKRVSIDQFSSQGRYGQGITAWKLPANVVLAGMTVGEGTEKAILFLEKMAAKAIRLDDAPLQTRTARGKSILETKNGDRVFSLSLPFDPPRPGVAQSEKKPVKKTRSAKTAAVDSSAVAGEAVAKSVKKTTATSAKIGAKQPAAKKVIEKQPTTKKAAEKLTTTKKAVEKPPTTKKPADKLPVAKKTAAKQLPLLNTDEKQPAAPESSEKTPAKKASTKKEIEAAPVKKPRKPQGA